MQTVTVFCFVLLFAVTIDGKATTTTTTPTTTTTESPADVDYALMAAAYCDIMSQRYKSWEHYEFAKLVAKGFHNCAYPSVLTYAEQNAMTGCQTIAFGGQLDDPFTFYDSVCVGTNAMTVINPKVVMLNACLTTAYYWLNPDLVAGNTTLTLLGDSIWLCQFEIVLPKSKLQLP